MPIHNITKDVSLTYQVTRAANFLARFTGLLGTEKPDLEKAFYIFPCKGLHTFGMKYLVDVVFLDRQGKVIKIFPNLPPNKMTKIIPNAHSALEFPSNTIKENQIEMGDQLEVITDTISPVNLKGLTKIFHWPANIFIALLWSNLVLSSFLNWQQNGGILSLGLVFINTLLVLLFITRRESNETSHHVLDWIIPILTVVLSLTLRPHPGTHSVVNISAAFIQFLGIIATLISLLSLGRSFGIIPANRKIKLSGFYKMVRHPVYASEMLFYLGFLLGNFTVLNLLITILIFSGQVWRALSEEKLLSKDNQYSGYMQDVKYRFLPGIL